MIYMIIFLYLIENKELLEERQKKINVFVVLAVLFTYPTNY